MFSQKNFLNIFKPSSSPAKRAQKLAEENYRTLFQYSPVPKFIYDPKTLRILDVNEMTLQKYGYNREEFLDMSLPDFRPAEEIEAMIEAHKNRKEQNGMIHFGIFTHLKKDKTKIIMEVAGNNFSFHGKDCILVVCTDVTERENALRFLRSTGEKLLAAQEIAKIGYWKYDMLTEKLFWSDEVYKIWGVSRETFILNYPAFFQSIHPEDLVPFQSARALALTGKKEMDFEFRIVRPDGSEKWIHEKGKLVRNHEGKPVSFEGTVQDVTESKILKLSLEESNQRYEYATKATFDAIWDWRLGDENNYWGEGFFRSFGYDLKSIRSQTDFWLNHIHPDDREKTNKGLLQVINGTESNWNAEYRFEKADKKYAFVSDRAIIIRDKDGKTIRMVGAMRDISEMKILQQLLDKANRLAKIGSWEIDVERKKVYWSPITKEIRETEPGYQPTLEDGIGHFKEGFSRDTIIKRVSESIQSGKSWKEDLEIYTHKGNIKWVRTIGKAEFVDGKCVKVYGSFQDIDASKKAELEIRKLYEEKNTILESIGDAFFTVNKNWIVTYWNNHAEKMLQTPKNEIVGKNLWKIFADSIDSTSFKKYEQAVATGKKSVFEDYYTKLNKWFEVSCYPSENGLSVYFKDITERKTSQIKLNQLNASLEKTANELAVSNSELEQFAYIASHDLQEPLRMVTGFLSLLEKKYSNIIDAEGKEYIHYAVDGAKRMRQMILNLLEFSKVGRFNGKSEEVDINELVKNVESLYKKKIEDTGATIISENLPVIKTYKSPLQQVIQNLVSNGLKYHEAGKKPIIHISAEKKASHWQFAVSDNGIGIDPDYYERIFILFQRLHENEEYSGTGMGLAIVKKIVEAMGGEVWIASEKGKGSTFFFTIKI
jgi:PAS domain S-box-containing protein